MKIVRLLVTVLFLLDLLSNNSLYSEESSFEYYFDCEQLIARQVAKDNAVIELYAIDPDISIFKLEISYFQPGEVIKILIRNTEESIETPITAGWRGNIIYEFSPMTSGLTGGKVQIVISRENEVLDIEHKWGKHPHVKLTDHLREREKAKFLWFKFGPLFQNDSLSATPDDFKEDFGKDFEQFCKENGIKILK